MRLVVQSKGTTLTEVSCAHEAVYIGSRPGCRIHLPDAQVAPELAVIFPEGHATWVLQPLERGGELELNGVSITDKVAIRSGDQIRIHDFLIRAELDEEVPTASRPAGRTTVANLTRFVQYQLPPGTVIKRPEEALVLQPAQLARLAQDNRRLGQCTMVEELMEFLLRALLEGLASQRAWVGVRRVNYGPMEYVEGRLLTGQTFELTSTGENLKPRVLDRGQFLLLPFVSPEEPYSVLAGPLFGPDGTLGMVYLDTGDSGRRFDTSDLDFFVVALTYCGAQLDAIFKQLARQKAAMIDGEVSVAHAIQARLTPRKLPQWEQLQWGAFREPGRERTSDVYDVVRLSNQMAGFMLAHTSATGPMPSMLMSQAQATFRAAAMHLDAPHTVLRMLNHLLYDGQQDHPLDCFVGVLDPASGEMRYAQAGWMGAYIISARGEERRLGPPEPTPSVGLEKGAAYAQLTETLGPAETLVLFTPGVTTARNRQDEIFGEERFVNILCDGFGQLASATLKEMLSDLRHFTEAGQQPDDITVLLAHRVA